MDPIIKKYFDLIKSQTPAFKSYYYGDPILIPMSSTPALIGARRASRASTFTNIEDQHDMTLVFTIVADVRATIQDDKTLTAGNNLIYDLMEGRDPITLKLKDTALVNILRHTINIDPTHQLWTDVSAQTQIDYGLVANKRALPSWSIEASLTTVATLVQTR